MAYNEHLFQRIANLAGEYGEIGQIFMFGGVCFTLNGHIVWGVKDDELIVRVGPDAYERALAFKHARPFDMTGRPMKGYVFVVPEGFANKQTLRAWLDRGFNFVSSLPAKKEKHRRL